MKQTYSIHGMTCSGCAATVELALKGVPHVKLVRVSLDQANAEIEMDPDVSLSDLQEALKPWSSYKIGESAAPPSQSNTFWTDLSTWRSASRNTLNCLFGCSLGDFGMIVFLQAYYPNVSMSVQMVLATIAGLLTSVMLESVLLRTKEGFGWSLALRTAFSMSFLSMVAMELVMNTTDFMITGGKAAFGNSAYWGALVLSMIAGFIAPLPYNYHRLKKFNLACH